MFIQIKNIATPLINKCEIRETRPERSAHESRRIATISDLIFIY